MNNQSILRRAAVLLMGVAIIVSVAAAQKIPVAPQPEPKGQQEMQQLQAIQNAITPQSRLAEVDTLGRGLCFDGAGGARQGPTSAGLLHGYDRHLLHRSPRLANAILKMARGGTARVRRHRGRLLPLAVASDLFGMLDRHG